MEQIHKSCRDDTVMTMTKKQKNQSWHNMKLHLVHVAWGVVEEDPKNLNTLDKCYRYIQNNFDIMATVKQIDSRTKDWLWVLVDDKEVDTKLLDAKIRRKAKYLEETH